MASDEGIWTKVAGVWQKVWPIIGWNKASGGEVSEVTEGGKKYRQHIFRANGTFTVEAVEDGKKFTMLCVGGGGSTGSRAGGPGGQVWHGEIALPKGPLHVDVGAGGRGAAAANGGASSGGPSGIPNIISASGGQAVGGNGPGTGGAGNNGANPGGAAGPIAGGPGGAGVLVWGTWYGGGGGGGTQDGAVPHSGGAGGNGGGGEGAGGACGPVQACSGLDGHGGGGGGSFWQPGNGGSGIVIIRYEIA